MEIEDFKLKYDKSDLDWLKYIRFINFKQRYKLLVILILNRSKLLRLEALSIPVRRDHKYLHENLLFHLHLPRQCNKKYVLVLVQEDG